MYRDAQITIQIYHIQFSREKKNKYPQQLNYTKEINGLSQITKIRTFLKANFVWRRTS